MKHLKLKLLGLTFFLLIATTTVLNVLGKDKTSAANTTFNISAGADAVASGDGCRLSEAIANINASAQTHSDCPEGVSVSGDINVISLPADTVTLTTDLPIITKPTNILGQGKQVSVVDGNNLDNAFGIILTGASSSLSLEYENFTVKNLVDQKALQQENECLTVAVDSTASINVENVDAIDCAYTSIMLGTRFLIWDPAPVSGPSVSIKNSNISRTGSHNGSSNGLRIFGAIDSTVDSVTVSNHTIGFTYYSRENTSDGTLSVNNSTIEGNARGVGISSNAGSGLQATLTNNTIYGNHYELNPAIGAGILAEAFGSNLNLTIQNNLIADNVNNCQQTGDGTITITSSGNNLSDSTAGTCLDNLSPNDILSSDIDSTISALADNGGAVKTLALLPGSPAIDTAATVDTITTDARGFARPFGVAYDIGAFEYGSGPVDPPPPPKPPKTGRLAAASLITVSILAIVLLIAKGFKGRLHRSQISRS